MSGAINEGISIIQHHQLILPAKVSSLFRVVVLLEGSSRLLNPDFNIAVLFQKYHFKILRRRYSPQSLIQRLFKNIHQWQHIMELTPKVLEKLLRTVGKDNFEINLEHRNLERSVNRLVMGLITASMFLGSSFLWALKVPPVFNGYSLFGIIGVAVSIYLGWRLIKDII